MPSGGTGRPISTLGGRYWLQYRTARRQLRGQRTLSCLLGSQSCIHEAGLFLPWLVQPVRLVQLVEHQALVLHIRSGVASITTACWRHFPKHMQCLRQACSIRSQVKKPRRVQPPAKVLHVVWQVQPVADTYSNNRKCSASAGLGYSAASASRSSATYCVAGASGGRHLRQ